MSQPSACPDCLRRSRLLAHLAPYIEKLTSGTPGVRSPELLRLSNEDLAAAVAPKVAAQVLAQVEAVPEQRLQADLLAAQCWACCRHDSRYPDGLREAADAPWALIGRGDPALLERLKQEEVVTLVGSRRASTYGREVARSLGQELGAAGMVIASGLAFGIDACVHRGALDTGTTIAVLGCGADISYPASHRSLWRRICESGLVLSELPPGTGAWRWTFPARNRILAGIAGMTVVIEAAKRSGSLITADLAADLGRELGAVPGPVNSRGSAGTNDLLAGGASLVRDAQDVLDAMLGPGVRAAERVGAALEPRLLGVLTAVERGEETSDAVAAAFDVSPAQAASDLATLEVLGYLSCSLVGVYSRTPLSPVRGEQ
jgi:DNA processing protein